MSVLISALGGTLGIQMQSDSKCWIEGIRAFEAGGTMDDCPYEAEKAVQWQSGYNIARVILRDCSAGSA